MLPKCICKSASYGPALFAFLVADMGVWPWEQFGRRFCRHEWCGALACAALCVELQATARALVAGSSCVWIVEASNLDMIPPGLQQSESPACMCVFGACAFLHTTLVNAGNVSCTFLIATSHGMAFILLYIRSCSCFIRMDVLHSF